MKIKMDFKNLQAFFDNLKQLTDKMIVNNATCSVAIRKHLVLVTDSEKGDIMFAYDNPGFKDASNSLNNHVEKLENNKIKWPQWTSMGLVQNNSNLKVKAMDDTYHTKPVLNIVPLRSHDFTGLGFNICGNMRDGIFIKDVLHRGPASESGRILPGDKIESIKISLRHMVFEDALTILSYASPYEVELEVETRNGVSNTSTLMRHPPPPHKIIHPFYKSHSISDLQKIGKSNSKNGDQSFMSSEHSFNDTPKYSSLEKKTKIEAEKNQNVRNLLIESHQQQENVFHTIDLNGTTDEIDKSKDQLSPGNMKSLLVKRIQNLKEKLQNSLHHDESSHHKEEVKNLSNNSSKRSTLDNKKDEGFTSVDLAAVENNIPEEVIKTGSVARNYRKSLTEDSLETLSDNEEPTAAKRSKRKPPAPKPPQINENEMDELKGSAEQMNNINGSNSVDSDSEMDDKVGTTIELNASHITVHHAANENDRKASSLGDLSRYDTSDGLVTLERAVSLDLADNGSNSKKRKAPMPPQDGCVNHFKEVRVDNGQSGTLKKSNVWGTLEDVIKTRDSGSDSETDLGISGCSTPERTEIATSTPYKLNSTTILDSLNASNVELNSFSLDNSLQDTSEFVTAINGDETPPPDLPKSPMPTLDSFITEIQVLTMPKLTNTEVVYLHGTEGLMEHVNRMSSQEDNYIDCNNYDNDVPSIKCIEETSKFIFNEKSHNSFNSFYSSSGLSSPDSVTLTNKILDDGSLSNFYDSSRNSTPSPPNRNETRSSRNNVSVTNIKSSPSRIPVRAGQRSPGVKHSPGGDTRRNKNGPYSP